MILTKVSFVSQKCLGKSRCSIVVERETFEDKKCPEIVKTLAVQVKCEKKQGNEQKSDDEEEDDDEEEEEKEREGKNQDLKDREKQKQDH